MKRTILILLLGVTTAIAATLTIDIPANDVPRVSEAFGSIYNLGHNANINEVAYHTREWIIQSTKDYERRKNMSQYTPPPLEMQPTPTPTPTPGAGGLAPGAPETLTRSSSGAASIAVSPTPTPKKK